MIKGLIIAGVVLLLIDVGVFVLKKKMNDKFGKDKKAGVADGDNVEILSGLSDGDNIYYRYADTLSYTFLND